MPKDKSAMDEFLGDIPVAEQQQAGDIFGQELTGKPVAPEKEEAEEPHKNRQHRRLEARLQAERESNIALVARLEALTEAQRFAQETSTGTVDESLLRLYGDNENGRQAAKITQDLLDRTKQEARQEAIEAMQSQQQEEAQEVASSQDELDQMLDVIEDEFNVDLTSNTAQAQKARQGFYSTLEKVSPKNSEGLVKDYADPVATWEFYQSQNKSDNSRAKDLGSRSMTRSGASTETKLEATAQERFLRDAGII